ncbi:hypothetical protein [Tardiphaga sp.]|uniref:hypothetical protein n=1 Tax=Tardiphaga sp. TaxID=1926292 RepID=UPI00260AB5C8|nr:hypothetical protein [Tardiphaga sp.]
MLRAQQAGGGVKTLEGRGMGPVRVSHTQKVGFLKLKAHLRLVSGAADATQHFADLIEKATLAVDSFWRCALARLSYKTKTYLSAPLTLQSRRDFVHSMDHLPTIWMKWQVT